MLYRRFEQLIDIFREAPSEAPPGKVWPFYLYYLRQVWPSFLALLVVGLFASLIEVAMFSYLSRIIDLAQGTPNANFFSEHSGELIWMLVVVLLLRPLFFALHDLLVHQTISPGMTSMIRWQNHSYVLKQSLNFFQSDFAGRIAQRIMQTGNSLRDSAVQAVDALWLWSQSLISVGAIALSTGLVIRIVNMSGWIMWVVNGIFENIGMVQDGLQTIAQPVTVSDQPDAPPLTVSRGAVRFEQVGFHYGKGSQVIDGLDLDIRPGEKIGLIGPSGAGKSTLVNLLLRLYDVQAGRILIDGQDIAGVNQASLRAQIGMITQDTSLLHRSIRDNLLYGRPDATEAQVWEAVRRARADDFIGELSDAQGRSGFDAHVGERGVKLSGGQRQRIAIARVLLKNAPILIMDEATSALDSEVEAAIQESLETLMQGKTVIAIAHRLSTIARMDRLVVLDKGRIVEIGSHSELLAQGGLYARLWQHQTGGFVGVD